MSFLGKSLITLSTLMAATKSESVTLTSTDSVSNIGSVSLESNTKNSIDSDGNFKCIQSNYDSFCVSLDIFNTGCDGIETIEIKVNAYPVSGSNTDIFGVFSLKNDIGSIDYISYFSDFSGSARVDSSSNEYGGVFTAPDCGSNELLNYNDDANDLIGTMWDRMGTSTNPWKARLPMVNMDIDNWQFLTDEKITEKATYFTYKLVNDLISNTLNTYFVSDTITQVSCNYNTAFDTTNGNDYKIGFQTDQGTIMFSSFDVTTTCEQAPTPGPTVEPTPAPTDEPTLTPTNKDCEYTHTCHAMGDPHITTFDGTLYHFQGQGYFDYLKSKNLDILPITISAKQEYSPTRNTVTRIQEILVSLSDGIDIDAVDISFNTNGINPTFTRSGLSAVGSHLFFNGKLDVNIGNDGTFEALFDLNDGTDRIGKIKFTYKGTTLLLETSDCLSEYIYGLCGSITNDASDDFEKCDTSEIIDNYGVSSPWTQTSLLAATIRENVNEFGESCCRNDLDMEYLGQTDCIITTPTETENCIDSSVVYDICMESWNSHCGACDNSQPSEEWLVNCGYDICLLTACEEKVSLANDGSEDFTLTEAENLGCLDTVINECEVKCPIIAPAPAPTLTVCDSLYEMIVESGVEKQEFHRWFRTFSNGLANHFYTRNEEFDGIASGYIYENFEGYIWSQSISGVTIPFYRFWSLDNIDAFYTINGNGILNSMSKCDHSHDITIHYDYEYQSIAGYIMTTFCNDFNQPLYRYWSDEYKDHFYTTDYRDNYDSYVFENVAGYVAKYKD